MLLESRPPTRSQREGAGGGSEGERGSGGHLGGEKQLKTAATAGDHNPVMGSLRGAGGAGRGRQK